MPIHTLQRQMRELGRIRTGVQVAVGDKGKTRPSKLETFRLTSKERALVDAAAAAYGGTVAEWREGEYEVITTSDALDILVPPWQALSQWFELWSAGGCQRRCDGRLEALTDSPCLCPADPEDRRAGASANPPTACKPTTRLNVMLPALPDLGVWRLESHGFYAAVELAGAAQMLELATRAGVPLPARLRLDQRTKKVPGKPTNRYAVPVIEILGSSVGELLAAAPSDEALGSGGMLALGSGAGRPRILDAPETELEAASDFRAADPVGDNPTGNPPDAVPLGVPMTGVVVDTADPVGDAPAPAGLTRDQFRQRMHVAKIADAYVVEVARLQWPTRDPRTPYTDAERLVLWGAVERALAGGAI